MRAVWGMAFLLVVSAACSETLQLTHTADAGVDAGPTVDAGPDAGADAGPDAGPGDAGCGDGGPGDGGQPTDGGLPDAGWSGVWQPFGPPLGHEAQVYPAMALDPSGALLVAHVELVESPGTVATELHVVRWSGSAWDPLGGTVASSTERFPYSAPLFVRLATEGTGRPVLAFGDSGPGATIGAFPLQTWTFDGSRWQPVPVPVSAPQLSGIALARGSDGQVRLVLATGHELRMLVLGASGWTEILEALVLDAGVSEPELALAADGTPLIAFSAAASPGSFGTLHAFRWRADAGWSDLGLPSPAAEGLLFHTPRIHERRDGGVVVAASEWQYEPLSKLQVGVAVPVFSLGEGGWSLLEDGGQPGGFALSEPIPGSPVGLQLANDVPVVVSTGADGGVSLRALLPPGAAAAPVLGGLGAGTLLLMPDGSPLVGAVLPVSPQIGPQQTDGGQVQILHFTGTTAEFSTGGEQRSR
ncbi:MAG TPA: hypothetical protein VFD38_07060 [Myxococcaceae bacterium]|nr:hypothetical protein [Myxococcaceae bacterium]